MRVTIISLTLLFSASIANADPRAMMMQAAWLDGQRRAPAKMRVVKNPRGVYLRTRPASTLKIKPVKLRKSSDKGLVKQIVRKERQASRHTPRKVRSNTPKARILGKGSKVLKANGNLKSSKVRSAALRLVLGQLQKTMKSGGKAGFLALSGLKQRLASWFGGSGMPGQDWTTLPFLAAGLRIKTLQKMNPSALVHLRDARIISRLEYEAVMGGMMQRQGQ